MKDILADLNMDELKTSYMAEKILREEPMSGWHTEFKIGEPNVEVAIKKHIRVWGSYRWETYTRKVSYTLPSDWYQRVYLAGVGKVTYLNRTTLVMDAEPIDVKLRDDLNMPGFEVYKVKLPVEVKRKHYSEPQNWEVAERFMVVCHITDGEDSLAFAAKHANAAAANLKKKMMREMSRIMGV